MRKRYGSWAAATMLAVLVVLCGISSSKAQGLINPKYYPTLSLRNFHSVPDGIIRVPAPSAGGDRYFLVPVYIFNEVDTTFNPNVGGQHLEPIRSFEFQMTYLTQAMVLDTFPGHGSPVVVIGPTDQNGNNIQGYAKTFFVDYSDQADASTGNPYLHRIRLAASSSVPLPLANSADSGITQNNGILLWLRFKVIVSNVNAGQLQLDSSLFNDHRGDSLDSPRGTGSFDYTHGNFGGGIGLNGLVNRGGGLVQITAQPVLQLLPLSQITQLSNANDSLTVDLVYDPTQPGVAVTRDVEVVDAIGNTELDNVSICSDQSWLSLSVGGPGGGSQCCYPPNILFTSSFGSQVRDVYLNVTNPGALAPGIYYGTITYTANGALNSPLRLRVRFVRLANPNEPTVPGTGIRLNISNNCSPVCTSTIAFGTGPGATEGIDVLYGEQIFDINARIAADTNVVTSQRCYAYFKPLNPSADPAFLDPNFLGITRDIRSGMTDTTLIFQVVFSPGDINCYPVKVCVDPADFPPGGRIFMKFTLNGAEQGIDLRNATIDQNGMRCVTITDQRINTFYIEYTPGTIASLATFLKLNSWNLISLPVIPPNPDPKIIFPNNAGGPFLYRSFSSWTPETAMEFGRGYMIRYGDFIGPDAFVAGIRSATVTNVSIDAGWNSIGAASFVATENDITLTPHQGISLSPNILSDVWEFTSQTGYDQSAFLVPGHGYFIKTDASGFYNLTAPMPSQSKQQSDFAGKIAEHLTLEGQLSRVIVSDTRKNGQALYFGNAVTSQSESQFEMPAMFQEFDARFASNSGMVSFNKSNYVVNLHASSYPVTMTFSNLQGAVEVRDMTGNLLGFVTSNGTVTLTNPNIHQVTIAQKSSDAPVTNAGTYSLEPNTPNPFFPITTIRFQVPQETPVSLVVYNQLGQVVSTLVNQVEGAGIHEVLFDGTGLPSGTYYYTLKAGNFVQTERMTLNK